MNNLADVDLKALEDLQDQIRNIASVLKDYSMQVNGILNATSYEWQDSRFDKFAEEFQYRRTEIENLSESYMAWANGYLNDIIERVKEYNRF